MMDSGDSGAVPPPPLAVNPDEAEPVLVEQQILVEHKHSLSSSTATTITTTTTNTTTTASALREDTTATASALREDTTSSSSRLAASMLTPVRLAPRQPSSKSADAKSAAGTTADDSVGGDGGGGGGTVGLLTPHSEEDPTLDSRSFDHLRSSASIDLYQKAQSLTVAAQCTGDDDDDDAEPEVLVSMVKERATSGLHGGTRMYSVVRRATDSTIAPEHSAGNVNTRAVSVNVAIYAENMVPVVIDNGTGYIKAGFACDPAPQVVLPALVGLPKYTEVILDDGNNASSEIDGLRGKSKYLCREAQSRRGVLSLSYPIHHGIVQDWDSMEEIWTQLYTEELGASSEDHPVILTDPPMNPKKNREKMAEIMFETFQVPAFYVKVQAVLSLLSTGSTTGVAVDSGDGVTHAVPVLEGYAVEHAVQRMDVAGRDVTAQLQRLLTERGTRFSTSAEFEIVRNIKEALAYTALDFTHELEISRTHLGSVEQAYELPDGRKVVVGSERFRCAEVLFQPNLMGKEGFGIHQCCYEAIAACDVDMRQELLGNVILSGGSSMIQSLPKRLSGELRSLFSGQAHMVPKIVCPPERSVAVWLGGAMLAEMPTFEEMWVTQTDYAEFGKTAVHEKCI